ncbi:MAG TPA: peptidoglycan-binding domain-containing protein [Alphaproteobacteria bacterium]|nr:peptidoglycan-binding domain-containing protein [Alphaproteobacteria bacterium]
MVLQAQDELRELDYDPGPLDGILGPRTARTLRNYQRDYGLPVTGTLNAQTRRELLGAERTAVPEDWRQTPTATGRLLTEGEIQVAEQNLAELGFDPGLVDGIFTAQTEAAVRAFQERRGLPVTGILDSTTQQRLLRGIGPSGTTPGG